MATKKQSASATEEETPEKPRLTDLDDDRLRRKLRKYTDEYQLLSPDQSPAAVTRRVQLTRLLRGVQDVLDAREPLVEVTVPRSVTGEPYQVGPAIFPPGVHHVRASVARYLLWMIGENHRQELNRLKSSGRELDLSSPGTRARMARIARDDGTDDWSGRER